MGKKFLCKLVTAERPYFDGECESLKIPAFDGMMGVYADHAPFVTELGTGVAEIEVTENEKLRFAVQNGFIQIVNNEVTVVAERMVNKDEINTDELKTNLLELREEILKGEDLDDKEKKVVEFNWLKASAQLSGIEY